MSLNKQVTDFAQRIEDLLSGVLGISDEPYTGVPEGHIDKKSGTHFFVVKTKEETGVALKANSCTILSLNYNFKCSCRNDGSYLQVDDSTIIVCTIGNMIPIFHYDYLRNPQGKIPSAHINVHASNDDAVKAMLACGNKRRGKSRRKNYVANGTFPTFSTLHFPVGGDRFRPGMEDVLEMLVDEFGIDVENNYQQVIENSRAEYRTRQLCALVREFPDIVYDELQNAGYDLKTRPKRPIPRTTKNRLIKY